jgi:hypothetical protein
MTVYNLVKKWILCNEPELENGRIWCNPWKLGKSGQQILPIESSNGLRQNANEPSERNWSLSWANVSKWLPCAEIAATISKAPWRFMARNCLAEISCSGEEIEMLKANVRRLIQWKSIVGWKFTQMKPFQPKGSHLETLAQLRDRFLLNFSPKWPTNPSNELWKSARNG